MRKLNKFVYFDWEGFSKDKIIMAIRSKPWIDNDTKVTLGTRVDYIFIEDNTDYNLSEDEDAVSNKWEKGTAKIRKNITVPENAIIQFQGVNATVYGENRNQLSIEAENVVVVKK